MVSARQVGWWAVLASLAAGAAVLPPRPQPARGSGPPVGVDSLNAERFLEAVRGVGPIACDMIIRSLGMGRGWWSGMNLQPDASREHQELLRWVTQRREDPGAIPTLRAGLDDRDACVRRTSARLLGQTRHAHSVTALLEALDSPNPTTRQLAAVGLGYAEDRAAVDPLVDMLRDDLPEVRAAGAWALGAIEDQRAVLPLAKLLREDPESEVRLAAALALGNMF